MKKSKILYVLVALLFCTTLFAGGQPEESSMNADGTVTLTYFTAIQAQLAGRFENYADRPFYKKVMEATDVNIEFIHPPVGMEKEQFNLLVASRDLPDMISWNWVNDYPGGPGKAISDEIIIPINDLIDQSSPNYKKQLSSNPAVDKQAKLDSGEYYAYGRIMADPINQTYFGIILRQDWLDDLNLEVPTTIDEWHTVLTAFKNEKGADVPLSFLDWMMFFDGADPFLGAFGTGKDFIQKNGKVVYGAIQPEFKEYLTLFNEWYNEGLLDPEFAANDSTTIDAKVTTGRTGVTFGFTSGTLGRYNKLMRTEDPSITWVGAPYPSLKKGEVPHIGIKGPSFNNPSAAITTVNSNLEASAKFLDYGYSDEGHMLYNFGIEGTTYTMVDGKPVYSDLVMKNETLDPMTALMDYAEAGTGPAMRNDASFREQMNFIPEMTQAQSERWNNSDNKYNMPWGLSPSPEESTELAAIMSEVETYTTEMLIKFIIGAEDLNDFDDFVSIIEKMNIDRAVEIKQDALNRYQNR